MQSYQNFRGPIKVLFTDIDDTLTTHGKLPPDSYEMLWKLSKSGIDIVTVTGRPAGWCEMIARFWPVKAVIGENGAFYFKHENDTMTRYFSIDEKTRKHNSEKLKTIEKEVLKSVPGSALASDQFTRLFDLAIDFCEDVPALKKEDINSIVKIFENHGAIAKVSSIHVNGWFGQYDKKTMCEEFYQQEYGGDLDANLSTCAFVGDSPNDEPMFGFFDNSFAVGNIQKFIDDLKQPPKYLIEKEGAEGFCQLGEHLIG